MFEAIKYGVGLGLLLSVLIGPVFFILINVSIKEGFRSAMYLDIGIILSDAICILISYLGLAALLEDRENRVLFLIIGSVVLIVMGVLKIFPGKNSPNPKEPKPIIVKKSNPFSLMVQGFFYNFLNPSVLLFWISTVGGAMALYDGESKLIWTQFSAVLLTVFLFDILKAWFAKKMRSFITEDKIFKANRIIGIAFIVFALILLTRTFLGKI